MTRNPPSDANTLTAAGGSKRHRAGLIKADRWRTLVGWLAGKQSATRR